MITALGGGVGGAKLAFGLARLLGEALSVVVNTGDDFSHLGLSISPDLDTVCYTLAGLADEDRGWGLAQESWRCAEALSRLGGPTWFRLGDADLATHLFRTQQLAEGRSLSEVTRMLCARFGVGAKVMPMTDDPVRTLIRTDGETLAFQDYFVRLQCEPCATGVAYQGADRARAPDAVLRALQDKTLEAVIVCPSNPFLSIDPILAVPGIRQALAARRCPVVAVSPIVGGRALKGPAAKLMAELGLEVSPLGVAAHYEGLIDGIVIDRQDEALARPLAARGLRVQICDTVMRDCADRVRLAQAVLEGVRR